jgi:hypothetical protein
MKTLYCTLAVAILVSGCATSVPVKEAAAGGFEIVQTNFPGWLWNAAHAEAAIISQDGGQSFAVPGGALWAFGDTFKGSRSPDGTPHYAGGAVSCAIAFLAKDAPVYPPGFDFFRSNNVVRSPFELLPEEKPPERYRLWPLGGIYVNGRSYLYYSLIEIFGNGAWDFRGTGSGLSRATANALGTYERLQPHGNWRYPVEPIQVLEADGWLYLFSIVKFGDKSGVELARVRPEKIEEPEAYEFYAGRGPKFSTRKQDAVCLVKDVPGQVSVAWNAYLQKYVMASSSDFFRPREIRLLAADAPAGPWSAPVARIWVPERCQGKPVELVYGAYLHPELFREDGRVMTLTYSLGLKDAGFDANCEMVTIKVKRQDER